MPDFNIHNNYLYNTILSFSRNKFFYREISLSDTFETRLYLMFIHFSIIMIVYRKKDLNLIKNITIFFTILNII